MIGEKGDFIMTIQEFIRSYLSENMDLKTMLEIRTYIPIAEKRAILETILDKCFTVNDGVVVCDYVLKRVMFELAMIKYHTNLEVDIMSEDDYDALKSICSFNTLHNEYGEDYIECQVIFDGIERDLHSKYSIETSVIHLSNQLSGSIENVVNIIANKIDDLDMSKFGFDGMELNQFQELIKKYGK